MTKRPTISPALKVAALLHRVYLQFGAYLKCPISGEDMTPDDRVQFDHIHAVGLDGPNVYDNLRPVLVKPHQKKTKSDLRMIKKTRPGHTGKFVVVKIGPMTNMLTGEIIEPAIELGNPKRRFPSRPMESRKFRKGKRPMRWRAKA